MLSLGKCYIDSWSLWFQLLVFSSVSILDHDHTVNCYWVWHQFVSINLPKEDYDCVELSSDATQMISLVVICWKCLHYLKRSCRMNVITRYCVNCVTFSVSLLDLDLSLHYSTIIVLSITSMCMCKSANKAMSLTYVTQLISLVIICWKFFKYLERSCGDCIITDINIWNM